MPDVGIVMPVYKQKLSYLRLALRSILRQTYRNYWLVIVIDGAPIPVVRTIRKLIRGNRRVKVIWKKQNHGVASALNTGFELLKKRRDIRYLTWVSSDNIYYRNFISTLRRTFKQGPPQLGLVYSSFLHINNRGKSVFDDAYMAEFRQWQDQPKDNILDSCFIGASFMYKKKFAVMAGHYENEPVEDYDFWLKLTEYCDIQYVAKDLMKYRVSSPHSVSAQLKTPNQHRRWRYSYQLSKVQARLRRQLPCETTVIFPVYESSQHTISLYESILEQYYSNYKMLVVDLSPNGQVIPVLSSMADPRVHFISYPTEVAKTALLEVALQAQTPFTIIYGLDGSFDGWFLYNLVRHARPVTDQISTLYLPDLSTGQRVHFESEEPINNQLYRTERLIEALQQIQA
jgi:hypothetical protein